MSKHLPHWQDDPPLELVPDSCDPAIPGVVLSGYLGQGGECGCGVSHGDEHATHAPTGAEDGSENTPGEHGIARQPEPECQHTLRLYQSLDMDEYLEVRQEDVIAAVQTPTGWGPSYVRVQKMATVRHVRTFAAGVTSLFDGDIARRHLDRATSGGGGDDPPHSPNHRYCSPRFYGC